MSHRYYFRLAIWVPIPFPLTVVQAEGLVSLAAQLSGDVDQLRVSHQCFPPVALPTVRPLASYSVVVP